MTTLEPKKAIITTVCAICGQHGECYDDGEAYICLDRAACGKRELLARIESLQEQNAKLRGDVEMAQEALANQTRYAQKLERQHGAAVDTIERIAMERDALMDACKAALRMLNAKQAPSPDDLMVLHTQLSRTLKSFCPICRAPLRDGACPDAAAHRETNQ